jgi:hypothetical protein
MRVGLVDILEANYRLEVGADEWMRGVGEAVDSYFGFGLGVATMRYRIGSTGLLEPLALIDVNLPAGGVEALQRSIATTTPEYIARTWGALPFDIASNTGPEDVRQETKRHFRDYFEPMGWWDCLNINGRDPTNHGFQVAAWLPRRRTVTESLRERWSRVAAHLAAANRLRHRLDANRDEATRPETAEAILTPSERSSTHQTKPSRTTRGPSSAAPREPSTSRAASCARAIRISRSPSGKASSPRAGRCSIISRPTANAIC